MLSVFYAWARGLLDGVPEEFTTQLVLGQGGATVRLDLEAFHAIGRLVCWENGNYTAEIVDLDTHLSRYHHHGQLDPTLPIGLQLQVFLARLGLAPAEAAPPLPS